MRHIKSYICYECLLGEIGEGPCKLKTAGKEEAPILCPLGKESRWKPSAEAAIIKRPLLPKYPPRERTADTTGVGSLLRELLNEQHMRDAELAFSTGIPDATVSRYLSGKIERPGLSNLKKIQKILKSPRLSEFIKKCEEALWKK
jgi:DNA-binding Xre family transcriptional regulator